MGVCTNTVIAINGCMYMYMYCISVHRAISIMGCIYSTCTCTNRVMGVQYVHRAIYCTYNGCMYYRLSDIGTIKNQVSHNYKFYNNKSLHYI